MIFQLLFQYLSISKPQNCPHIDDFDSMLMTIYILLMQKDKYSIFTLSNLSLDTNTELSVRVSCRYTLPSHPPCKERFTGHDHSDQVRSTTTHWSNLTPKNQRDFIPTTLKKSTLNSHHQFSHTS
jgi:hypothetical protein